MGRVSQERAAEIAGIGRLDFLLGIWRIGVTPFKYSAGEVLDEAFGLQEQCHGNPK
jgi:hypothetical protein